MEGISGEKYVRKIELKLSKYLDVCNFFSLDTMKCATDEMCYGRNESIQMIGRFHYINGHSKSFVFHKHLFSFCRTIWKIYRWILIIRTCLEVNLCHSPMNVNFIWNSMDGWSFRSAEENFLSQCYKRKEIQRKNKI